MLPTIDISLIGVFLAIWAVVKTIASFIMQGLNWIAQQALALLIGSKFWATAFFIGAFLGISRLISVVFNAIGAWLFGFLSSSPNFSAISTALDYLNTLIPLSRIASSLSYFFTLFFSFRLVEAHALWFGKLFSMYTGIVRAWKN